MRAGRQARLAGVVRRLHECRAMWVETVRVELKSDGDIEWSGDVEVFEVFDVEGATCCYAWTEAMPGTDRQMVVTILDRDGVATLEEAVLHSLRNKSS